MIILDFASEVVGALQQTLEGHSGHVSSIDFSSDGRWLVSSSEDDTVRLWNTTTGLLQQTLEGHSGWVTSATFSADGRLLASGSWDKTSSCGNINFHSEGGSVDIFVQGSQWITIGDEKILWLPPEYRSRCFAVKESTLALGHASGRISLIYFIK
ncbi:WD40-repeat-containing domain protein [Aspergillus spectabilis]